MKRVGIVLTLILTLAIGFQATAAITMLSGVTTTGAGTAQSFVNSRGALVHVYSAAGATAVVYIQGSVNNSVWVTLATITNPDAAGEAWEGTAFPYLRANVYSRSAGTITAIAQSLSEDPGPWKSAIQPSPSVGAVTVTGLTNSALTATRVPYASTGGLFADDSTFTFDSSTKAVGATIFKGGPQPTIAAKATDGAISSAPGTIVITKGSALGSSTLATPTTTTHDGYILRIVSSTAYAHVISCASGKVNGGTTTTITFTSAAIGDSVTLVAYQGTWYVIGSRGTITLS